MSEKYLLGHAKRAIVVSGRDDVSTASEMLTVPAYEQRIILFLDILGFREIVTETKENAAKLQSLLAAIDLIRDMWDNARGSKQVSQFSDSIVVSYLLTEESAAFYLVNDAALTIIELAYRGFLMRGAITVGRLIHTDHHLVGPAMVCAYDLESKRAVYPRVLIDEKLLRVAETYHSSDHSPQEEAEYVRSFMTQDPIDGLFYYDYVSFNSVVANAGADADLYGGYLETLATLVETGLRNDDPKVQAKYLWLHRQYLEAINVLVNEPEDSDFSLENPDLCYGARHLPRLEDLAATARLTQTASARPG